MTNSMNLEQIKSQASLEQKLLIEKVETLVRLEYDKDDMLDEIRKDYISRVGRKIVEIIRNDYRPYLSKYCMEETYLFKEFCHRIGDLLREEFEC